MHKIDIYQLEFIEPKLREIMRDIKDQFGPQEITSLYRIGDNGVHGTLPLRAIDLRYNRKSKKIEKYLNNNWIYDSERPGLNVAWVHDSGQGIHTHLQVHPRTVRYE